ncbi:bifunctional glycosyltransferase family 2 protein/CDP-glycerol:glycerophosphate glycerophosphotransferase [Streptomyces sp. NPDC046821]|uniref:bifunctional glycosyltransferase/CDP-glycerol:glycerophosphate glycerophosphotransferase n=1 Tax=Streptomyces sp. NPDC046821 TaxID=3154702 RepID=UPI0033D49F78
MTCPDVTFVVTAHNAQGRLRAGVGSLLGQRAALESEVIVVDNRSTDLTGSIADELAAEHASVRALRLTEPRSPGAAREAGAQLARGRYLLFLDGGDELTPGALDALGERLAEAGEPDVLLFDHAGVDWRGDRTPGGDSWRLARAGRTAAPLAQRPWLLRTARVLANRLIRRDLHLAHRDLFEREGPDEALAAYGSLLAAEEVACLDHVCVLRHEPTGDRRSAVPADPYFELFDDYELLLAYAEETAVRNTLFDLMVRHYLAVVAGEELPRADRARFFHRASAEFTRHRPEDYRRPDGLTGIRHALLERDNYAGYPVLQQANRSRRRLLGAVGAAKKGAKGRAEGLFYQARSKAPLDPDLAVFSAYWDRGVTCNPAAISAKLTELAPHIRQVWTVRRAGRALVAPGTTVVSPGERGYWDTLARATYFVNNVNFPDSLVKRPGQIHVQTHHGTPLKRMGVDQLAHPATSRGVDYDALLARCSRWDFSVSANRHSSEVWERAYPVGFTSLDTGSPRNDIYYRATADDVLRARARLGLEPGTTALLYAPTHRDHEAGWTPRIDLERFARTLGPGFKLLVRGHYFYDRGASPLNALHRDGSIIDVSDHDSVEELALASDALVTDYSSLMFDYANLNRPILVFADDWETYATTRGVYFDITEEAPGVVARTQDELQEALLSGEWQGAEAARRLDRFRERFCEFDDGNAAERVVRRVFLGETRLPPVVPVAERTPAPTPAEAASAARIPATRQSASHASH